MRERTAPFGSMISLHHSMRWLWVLPAFVALWSLLYALSYLSIVTQPHAYELASRWMYEHVPPGSRILGVHWDDKLPLRLPGYPMEQYRYEYETPDSELEIYERDTPERLASWTRKLHRADYLVFPTARIPGSIPRIEKVGGEVKREDDARPLTTALLKLIYAGQLGYQLVQTVKVRPSIGPFTWNNDLADESLTVYDHPKVWIFQNVDRLPPEEMIRRVQQGEQYGPLPTLDQMLSMNADGARPQIASEGMSSFAAWIRWFLIVELLALVVFLVGVLFVPVSREVLFAWSKAAAFLVIPYLVWVFHAGGVITGSVSALWLVVLGAVFLTRRGFSVLRRESRSDDLVRGLLSVELIWLTIVVFWTLFRSFQPEIHWGEKPMDSAFLRFFMRNDLFPPQDPWAAGNPMQYYYLGFYLFGVIAKVAGVEAGFAFNLGVVTVAASFFLAIYGTVRMFGASRTWAVGGAGAACLLSNLDWPRRMMRAWSEQRSFSWDDFWATARVFEPKVQFVEYPQWSILFADLHPHVMVLPIVALAVGLLAALARTWLETVECPELHTSRIAFLVLVSFVLGSVFVVNSWDFIALGVLAAVLGAAVSAAVFARSQANRSQIVQTLAVEGLILALCSFAFAAPFLFGVSREAEVSLGYVTGPEFNSIFDILRHIGLWIFVACGCALLLPGGGTPVRGVGRIIIALVTVVPVVTACHAAARLVTPDLYLWLMPTRAEQYSEFATRLADVPWGIVALSSVLSAIGAYRALRYRDDWRELVASSLLIVAAALISFVELFFLMDRMNTVFKFYQSIWQFLAVASAYYGYRLWEAQRDGSYVAIRRAVSPIMLGVGAMLLMVPVYGAWLNFSIHLTYRRIEGPRPTLDGTAFLERSQTEDSRLVTWMNRYIRGTPTIVEAQGASYQAFTRISMHTGLPTVLGWEHHVKQRGTSAEEVARRRADVRELYTSADRRALARIIGRYGVQFIVVGRLERETFGDAVDRLQEYSDLLIPVVRFGSTVLYGVVGSPLMAEIGR